MRSIEKVAEGRVIDGKKKLIVKRAIAISNRVLGHCEERQNSSAGLWSKGVEAAASCLEVKDLRIYSHRLSSMLRAFTNSKEKMKNGSSEFIK